jgi:hypothetical protein
LIRQTCPRKRLRDRLHLTQAEFEAKLPELLARGFPAADPTTGMFDLEAIDVWRRSRFPRLFRLTVCNDRLEKDHNVFLERIDRL